MIWTTLQFLLYPEWAKQPENKRQIPHTAPMWVGMERRALSLSLNYDLNLLRSAWLNLISRGFHFCTPHRIRNKVRLITEKNLQASQSHFSAFFTVQHVFNIFPLRVVRYSIHTIWLLSQPGELKNHHSQFLAFLELLGFSACWPTQSDR